MRAERAAFARVERVLKKCAEDFGLDMRPVEGRGLPEQDELD
jgi:hypothetical protein